MTPKIGAEKISLAKKLKSKNSNLDKWKCENVWNVRSKSIEFLSVCEQRTGGKWQRSETPSLSFRHFHFPTNLHFFSSLLISNEDELNADERRCGKLTDYTDCSKSGAGCPKIFSKELSSHGKSRTGNARPCDILSGQIGKTLLPLSQSSMWLAWARLPLWQWDENQKTNKKNCNNENNTDSVYSIRIWQTLLAVVKILEWLPNTSPHITRQLYKRSELVKLSIESIYRFSTWFGTDSIQWTLWRW